MNSVDPSQDGLLGYRLNEHGGNFVQVISTQHGSTVAWSFYQDFDLYQNLDHGILLSNDPRTVGSPIPPDTIGLDITAESMIWRYMPWRSWFTTQRSRQEVISALVQRLLDNLSACLSVTHQPYKIVFTGGLDSSLLAFMALHHQHPFQCVINQDHRHVWSALPFADIIYRRSESRPDPWLPDSIVSESYYDDDMTDCITGFFGDTAMTHNRTLYDQCAGLDPPSVELYDRNPPDPAPRFTNQFQAKQAVLNIMRTARFRQWFQDFRILDPYRDPGITQLVLSLPWVDLCAQFGNAWIQRDIIESLDPTWCEFLLQHKNEYPVR